VVGLAIAVAAALVFLVVRRGGSRSQQSGPAYLDYLYPPATTADPRGPGVPGGPQHPGGPGYNGPS